MGWVRKSIAVGAAAITVVCSVVVFMATNLPDDIAAALGQWALNLHWYELAALLSGPDADRYVSLGAVFIGALAVTSAAGAIIGPGISFSWLPFRRTHIAEQPRTETLTGDRPLFAAQVTEIVVAGKLVGSSIPETNVVYFIDVANRGTRASAISDWSFKMPLDSGAVVFGRPLHQSGTMTMGFRQGPRQISGEDEIWEKTLRRIEPGEIVGGHAAVAFPKEPFEAHKAIIEFSDVFGNVYRVDVNEPERSSKDDLHYHPGMNVIPVEPQQPPQAPARKASVAEDDERKRLLRASEAQDRIRFVKEVSRYHHAIIVARPESFEEIDQLYADPVDGGWILLYHSLAHDPLFKAACDAYEATLVEHMVARRNRLRLHRDGAPTPDILFEQGARLHTVTGNLEKAFEKLIQAAREPS